MLPVVKWIKFQDTWQPNIDREHLANGDREVQHCITIRSQWMTPAEFPRLARPDGVAHVAIDSAICFFQALIMIELNLKRATVLEYRARNEYIEVLTKPLGRAWRPGSVSGGYTVSNGIVYDSHERCLV